MKKVLLYAIVSLLLYSCEGRNYSGVGGNSPDPRDTTSNEVVRDSLKPVVNVYIENSGSMDGYVNAKGVNAFKGAVGRLLVDLKHYANDHNGEIKIYFICNDRYDKTIQVTQTNIEEDIGGFAKSIEVKWHEEQKKNNRGHNTNLNNVFGEILNRTKKNCVSVLVSDCIYSIGQGGAENWLNHEKNITYDAFLTKYEDKEFNGVLSTTILKMKSKFDGMYYPYTGDANKYHHNGELPYYICIFADQVIMSELNNSIDLESLEGYENKYSISKEDAGNVYYSILINTFNQGRFNPQRDGSKGYVHGIENIKLDKRSNNPLTFAIAMNLDGIEVDESYLLQADNYSLSDDDFEIVEVRRLKKSEVNPSDWNKISTSKPSHIMILRVTSKKIPTTELTISLKKQMPKWIAESSILDDTESKYVQNGKSFNGKSFGLEFWVTGISDAYSKLYPDNMNYFEFTINLKK